MANYMAEVAKMLGVERGEEFKCDDGYDFRYKITDSGLMLNGTPSAEGLMMLLSGALMVKHNPWKPSVDDEFWLVDQNGDIISSKWRKYTEQLILYKIGNCYSSGEKALANRDKWISFYASDEVLEV